MLRTLVLSGFIAAGLAGAAMAAEPSQLLVNRSDDAAAVFARRDNLVGGAARNADGSVNRIYQNQNGFRSINDGYNQPQAGAYEGN